MEKKQTNFSSTSTGLGNDKAELKNYYVRLRVTDRFRKPQHLQGTPTKERINWLEDVTVLNVENEASAKMAARLELSKNWPSKGYSIKVVEVEEM
jgi:hypothetical protein